KIGWKTATAIVVSNMIGTGVFTTLGFQVVELQNTITIFLLWFIGGVLALFGAFCYAELGTFFKGNGGDYIYLSKTYHPILGYLSSWISLVIGFSSPVSLAALAMAKYMSVFQGDFGTFFAIAVILLVALALSFSLSLSGKFHNFFTFIKVSFVVVLIIIGVLLSQNPVHTSINFNSSWEQEILFPAFATSLVFVTYAYTGWNSASYIAGEIDKPQKNLPKSLIVGTLFVTFCYVFINYIMVKHAPIEALKGKEDVMGIAANYMFGTTFGKIVNVFIALQLVATISGYLWVGSRITQATASENKLWSFLAIKNKKNIPVRAIFAHAIIAIIIIISTGSFKQIFLYTAFVLQLLSTLAISAAFFLKKSDRRLFKSNWFYLFPAVFVLFSFYILYFTFISNPKESLVGLAIVLIGIILYLFDKRIPKPIEED
ncbi:APC family permease, partial [Cloacibacterium sp.]|uniref:APC family permease n=1 Tax=Cloacibacterium sp. TaxID=1913682 RepID=UPI0035B36756